MRAGGAVAAGHFGGRVKSWEKSKGNPVSEADLAVDALLHARLTTARPGYGWLSEETEDDPARLDATNVFVVDPIDGTIAFLKGKPHFTVCAAVVTDGRPVAGVIFNPITDELFAAAEGAGARLNGAPIRVSDRAALEGARMLGARAMFEHPAWPQPWPRMDIEQRGSVAYRMALVACGQFDATLALSSKSDWDIAAGDVIVREAGGRISDHHGRPFTYNRPQTLHPSLVCAGPSLYDAVLGRVRHIDLVRKPPAQETGRQ